MGEREDTIPFSGRVGGDANLSCGEGKHKSPIVVKWGEREDTIPFSGRVGGNKNPSHGEGKHKSLIVVEWEGEKTIPLSGRGHKLILWQGGWGISIRDFWADNKFQKAKQLSTSCE